MIAALSVTVLAGLAAAWLWHRISRSWLLILLWRWHSGHALDGQHRTNATWLRRSHGDRPVLHPAGHAVRWHHLPRLHRAGIRTGSELVLVLLVYGLVTAYTATVAVLAATGAAGLGLAGWWVYSRVRNWRHHRKWVQPTRKAVTYELGMAPTRLEITRDRSEVTIGLPTGHVLTQQEQAALAYVVEKRLAIEAPEPQFKQHGRNPAVTFRVSPPPPRTAGWPDVAAAVAARKPDEIVFGLGVKGAVVSAFLGKDSPMVGFNMGSGGGKTNLASLNALQFLHDGDIAVIIDAKLISYPWARGLPNVAYADTIASIHDMMCWLGGELIRRNQVALAGLQPSGAIHANVGPRILVFAEELNYLVDKLKMYWDDLRSVDKSLPKRSPALAAIGDLAFAGRQVNMNVWFIGQMLTAKATGASDSSVRGNIGIACMARYRETTWRKMSDLPMPPCPDIPGRIQIVTAAGVRAAQVPYLRLVDDDHPELAAEAAQWAREYATSGVLTPLPAGMPNASPVAGVTGAALERYEGPEQPFVVRQEAPVAPRPPDSVTLKEAADAGLWPTKAAAARAVQRARLEAVGELGSAKVYRITDLAGISSQRVRNPR